MYDIQMQKLTCSKIITFNDVFTFWRLPDSKAKKDAVLCKRVKPVPGSCTLSKQLFYYKPLECPDKVPEICHIKVKTLIFVIHVLR